MAMKQSMDLFGEALLAYVNGDRSPFYLIVDDTGEKDNYSLAERFRPYSKLNKIERKLISLSCGQILDIGCGAGNVIPALEKRGEVTGIDISPKVIEVAKQRGCTNCTAADIFSYLPKQKFDTVTLFGNNLGIGGTVRKTKKLLQVMKSLLKNDGQILATITNYHHSDYKEMTLTPMWKNKIGPKFGWLIFNINFLFDLCKE
ncbi:class I SAM-dependent methyltransferase [Patescibacteria group bacterium]|nr:class I SAM-dependent methyltransferase [Patescibacteria group bacterium]